MAHANAEGTSAVGGSTVFRSGRAFLLAIGMAFLALFTTLAVPLAAYSREWGIAAPAAHSHLLTVLTALPLLLALAGVLVWWGPRLLRQAMVWTGGLGTCAVCILWVLLSGPRYAAFAPIPDGAAPAQMAASATVGAAAALTMIVADQVAWRRALADRT